jgi:nucleoside-diphosphate-sugar epimerase
LVFAEFADMSMRIAIVGASGLVGTALVERLLQHGRDDIVPLIHSSGSAWRLASLGLQLKQIDLLDAEALSTALDGCTHVVNCSRGDDSVMIRGLHNLLTVAVAKRVQRFVHLSSVAVYGDPPHPESDTEDAPTEPVKGSYGWMKLRQDRMVSKAASAGLNAITLCPPNIGGPLSYFFRSLVDSTRAGEFALIDHGATCCNVVDVDNLAAAIDLALVRGPGDGSRIFVTDAEQVTWHDVICRLAPLAGLGVEGVVKITREELARIRPPPGDRMSLMRSVKHLFSSDVREAMRKDPFWKIVDDGMRRTVALLGRGAETRVRLALAGSQQPAKLSLGPNFNYQLCAQQLRGVRHSSARARELLGYVPPHSFEESVSAFGRWYRWHHGFDGPFPDLVRELF